VNLSADDPEENLVDVNDLGAAEVAARGVPKGGGVVWVSRLLKEGSAHNKEPALFSELRAVAIDANMKAHFARNGVGVHRHSSY
jgi:hypothetical protein